MLRLRYTASAIRDLRRIGRYMASESDRATSNALTARLRVKCARIASLPGTLGQARPELEANLRSTPLGNYIIFFRYTPDALEIVNIVEAHRDIDGHFRSDA